MLYTYFLIQTIKVDVVKRKKMYLIKDIKKNHAKYQFHFFLFIHCVPYTNTAWTIKEIIGLLLPFEPEIHSSLYLSGGCFY